MILLPLLSVVQHLSRGGGNHGHHLSDREYHRSIHCHTYRAGSWVNNTPCKTTYHYRCWLCLVYWSHTGCQDILTLSALYLPCYPVYSLYFTTWLWFTPSKENLWVTSYKNLCWIIISPRFQHLWWRVMLGCLPLVQATWAGGPRAGRAQHFIQVSTQRDQLIKSPRVATARTSLRTTSTDYYATEHTCNDTLWPAFLTAYLW